MNTILTRHTFYKELEIEILAAKNRIIIDAYIWIYDEIGKKIAKSLLKSADNGVKIFIRKDLSASIFEHTPGRVPFFLKKEDLAKNSKFMSPKFFNTLGYHLYGKQDRPPLQKNYLLEKILNHPNITCDNFPLFNHGKLIIIDEISFIGGQCISKDYTLWKDYCIKIKNSNFTKYIIQKISGKDGDFSRNKELIFLQNTFLEKHSIYTHMKDFINSIKPKENLIIEMAYFGMWFFPILKNALKRGVRIQILASKESDTNQNTNMLFLSKLLRLNNLNLSIYLSTDMIHTKGMSTLNKSIIGAANFHSANGYFKGINEQSIYLKNKKLSKNLFQYFQKDIKNSTKIDNITQLPKWSKWGAIKEIIIVLISSYFIFFNKRKIQYFRNIINKKLLDEKKIEL